MKTKIRFDLYSPQILRDEIEKFLQSNKDAKTAAYMAITSLNQRYGVTDMDMTKAKNLTKLIKKQIIDKSGKHTTVYVKPEGSKTEWLNKFMNFFSFKSTGEVNQRIEADYKKLELDKKGVTWQDWKSHVSEYFNNKDKWDRFFNGKPAEKKAVEKKEEEKAKKADKKPVKQSFKLSLMKMVATLYGTAPVKKEEPVNKTFDEKSKELKRNLEKVNKANQKLWSVISKLEKNENVSAEEIKDALVTGYKYEKLEIPLISKRRTTTNEWYKKGITDGIEKIKSLLNKKDLKVGDMTTAGKIEEIYGDQYKIKGEWYHKNIFKPKPVENNFDTMPETVVEPEPEPVKEEPVKSGEESIQSKFDRWKSGDLTGLEGQKFNMTKTMMGKGGARTFFNEIVIDKVSDTHINYVDAVYGREGFSGMSMIKGFIQDLINGSMIPVGLEKSIDTGNGSKIETVKAYTPEQRKEVNADAKEAAREGYFNERPAEILNVGKDVWGAARHNYDTYKQMNADVNQMEKDGTAQAYVTKKNLFGDYGLANKDERIGKGETEYKVLASFVMREYLAKIPPNNAEDRAVYMDFCRAISRLDQETVDAKTFYFGVADVFANMFPTEEQKPATPGQGISVLDMIPQDRKGKKPELIIGTVLTALFYSLNQQANQSRNIYYAMDKKERKQMDVMSAALLAETGKTNKTYNQLEVMIFGETKLAGVKMKKGDAVVFAENLKDRVYTIRIDFASDQDKAKYESLNREANEMTQDSNFVYLSNKEKEKKLPELNKKYGTNFTTDKSYELTRHIEELARAKSREAATYMIRTKVFPEEKGQIIRVGKSDIDIAFKFPDGRIRGFNMKPSELKPENVESVVKDIKGKTTRKLNLAVEKKVIRKGGKSFEGLSITEMQNKLSSDFQFKAIQYGNSVPDDERQYHTQWTLESMSDLAEITGIPIEQISARGKLAIAFGARGKAGALAHYEPGMKIINLTRANGYGSLAHEWGHFMDNILSADMGSYITESPRMKEKEVSAANLKIGSVVLQEVRKGKKIITERYYYDGLNPRYPFARLSSGQNKPDEKSQRVMLYKFKNNHAMKVQEPDNLPFMDKAMAIAEKSVESLRSQAENLDDIDKKMILNDGYLNSNVEAFARAFEAYVADKLENSGRKNTYLASVAKTTLDDGAIVYPQKELRKEINSMFDEFFAEINKNQEMKKAIDKLLKQNKNVYIKKTNPITGKPEYRKVK